MGTRTVGGLLMTEAEGGAGREEVEDVEGRVEEGRRIQMFFWIELQLYNRFNLTLELFSSSKHLDIHYLCKTF